MAGERRGRSRPARTREVTRRDFLARASVGLAATAAVATRGFSLVYAQAKPEPISIATGRFISIGGGRV